VSVKQRVKKLEQTTPAEDWRLVVNWDSDPGPPPEGVKVVEWDEGGLDRKAYEAELLRLEVGDNEPETAD